MSTYSGFIDDLRTSQVEPLARFRNRYPTFAAAGALAVAPCDGCPRQLQVICKYVGQSENLVGGELPMLALLSVALSSVVVRAHEM